MAVEVLVGGKLVDAAPGAYVIGRGQECQIVIDHPSVSRRHAMLTVSADGATIEDLGSRNGVSVNGEQLSGRAALKGESRVQIGSQEFIVFVTSGGASFDLFTSADQLHAGVTPSRRDGFVPDTMAVVVQEDARSPVDHEAAFDKALRALSDGLPHEALNLAGMNLLELQRSLAAGRRIDYRISKLAGNVALRLAQAKAGDHWIDYVFELYTQLDVLMPRDAVDALLKMADTAKPVNPEVVTRYLGHMAQSEADMDGNEKTMLKRIASYFDAVTKGRAARR
jgi:hypothetical protein